ncbi:hypothetical protein LXM60_14005 [Pandoraea sputorum]|uniref:hypothetical protein n=1 Tax=Pandoraea sputorum TaxID=93222 RepID=UPI001E38490C|nr:hypothetical protein [Pandoraea sputorum]MCE4061319.1 hypothetical protein [Pandoraea sputorum]
MTLNSIQSLQSAAPPQSGATQPSGAIENLAADLHAARQASSDQAVGEEEYARKGVGLPESVANFWAYDAGATQYVTFKDDFANAVNESVNEYIDDTGREVVDFHNRENDVFNRFKEDIFSELEELRGKFEARQSEITAEIERKQRSLDNRISMYTANRSANRVDLIREILLNVDARNLDNKLDGLNYMLESFPSEFKGFSPSKYHPLLVKLYPDCRIRLDGLALFSSATETDSSAAMREEIQNELLKIARDTGEIPLNSRKEFQRAIERCLDHVERNGEQGETKFIEDLLFGICTIPPERKLLALREYCAMFPSQVKEIDKNDLCKLIARISLREADMSEGLKCLGETSGYIFLPDDFFEPWQAAASVDPDSREGRRMRFEFSERTEDRISKIVHDGRDVDEVFREFLFGLNRIDAPYRLNAAALICSEFKTNLSRVFLKFGSLEFVEFINQCFPKNEIDAAFVEFKKIQYFHQTNLPLARFLTELREISQIHRDDDLRWWKEQDVLVRRIMEGITACFDDNSVDANDTALSILYGITDFDMNLRPVALDLVVSQKPELGRMIDTRDLYKWVQETFTGNLERFRDDALDRLLDAEADEESPTIEPKKEVQDDLAPKSMSSSANWALRFLQDICRSNGRQEFQMPAQFKRLSDRDKKDAVQAAVNWAIMDMDENSYRWVRPMSLSSDIRPYMRNTIAYTTYTRAAANLKTFVTKHNMVRPE